MCAIGQCGLAADVRLSWIVVSNETHLDPSFFLICSQYAQD